MSNISTLFKKLLSAKTLLEKYSSNNSQRQSSLISRIKAVLRRYEKSKSQETKILTLKNIKVDINQHTVFKDSEQIFLTIKEFDLLVRLIENRGNVLTREQLLDSIWKIDADIESRTVDVHVRTLRQKLGDETLIETVRGVGYKVN